MKNAWDKWMTIARKFANVQANVLLSIVYFLIIVPLGFLFGIGDKFKKSKEPKSYWISRKKVKQDLRWARKQ